jgi:CRISPR-associated protein Csx16
MTVWFVTRHSGAEAWARRRGLAATHVRHLDPGIVRPGDTVIGTLPPHLAADVTAQGARYVQLVLDLAEADRGRSLDADEMEAAGARLEVVEARRLGPYRPDAAPGDPAPSLWQRLRQAGRRWLARHH